MIETKQSLDVRGALASLSAITTEDGTVIINDPDVGAVSGRSIVEAEQEVQRRKAAIRSEAA